MQCLYKYRWVKLPRACLPSGKGILGSWAKLAARAAFRKGTASYCGYRNPVVPGMWSGGVVGLKSILGIRNRASALDRLNQLKQLGLVLSSVDPNTKLLTVRIKDWVVECSGSESKSDTVYTTPGYGFICVSRNLTEKLIHANHIFEDSDAWLDLWCHTVSMDVRNAFSFFAPVCQFGKYGVFLSLETLGQRWGWEKTKVWRFLQKHEDVFTLYRLPGSYGCLIFNKLYPCEAEVCLPNNSEIKRVIDAVRTFSVGIDRHGALRDHMSKMVVWYSRRFLISVGLLSPAIRSNRRVALFPSLYRAYLSLCKLWKNGREDCRSCSPLSCPKPDTEPIRGPCAVDLSQIAKEFFTYG